MISNANSRTRFIWAYSLVCFVFAVAGIGCGSSNTTNSNTNSAKASNSTVAKPTETAATPAEAKPAGKEIVPASGPAMKSVIPPDGAILGGVLNSLATTLPTPELPADAKVEKGTVTIEVLVNEKGEVVASSAVRGPQPLWSAAAAAARKARFDPPLKDGKSVKVAGVLTFDFGK